MMRFALLLLVACSSSPDIHTNALCDDPDAAVDSAPDAPPDAPPDAAAFDLVTPWPRHTMYSALIGADGLNLADLDGDGDLDAVSGFEEAGRVVVLLNPGPALADTPWPSVVLNGSIGAVEDAVFADVDADGQLDVIAASESKKVVVYFAPPVADLLDPARWTPVSIAPTVAGTQRWMQVALADMDGNGTADIVAGGKLSNPGPVATAGYFSSVTPRDGASWTYHQITEVGWVMSLVPFVGPASTAALMLSDRVYIDRDPTIAIVKDGTHMGSRWLERDTAGVWVEHTAYRPLRSDPKFMHLDGNRFFEGASDAVRNDMRLHETSDWVTWSTVDIPLPANIGRYHDVEPADIDGDGIEDLVISTEVADAPKSGVVWLRGPAWDRGEISGPDGTKFDNVLVYDVDGDGDPDVLSTEQNAGLGVVWYENPRNP